MGKFELLYKSAIELKSLISKKELSAATNVIKTGKLSQFKAAKSRNFYGGFYVRKFEDNLKKFYSYLIPF